MSCAGPNVNELTQSNVRRAPDGHGLSDRLSTLRGRRSVTVTVLFHDGHRASPGRLYSVRSVEAPCELSMSPYFGGHSPILSSRQHTYRIVHRPYHARSCWSSQLRAAFHVIRAVAHSANHQSATIRHGVIVDVLGSLYVCRSGGFSVEGCATRAALLP